MSTNRIVFQNIVIVFLYVFVGYLVFAFFSEFGVFPLPIWVPSSFSLIIMLINWKRYFLSILAGALIINLVFFSKLITMSVLPIIMICLGHTTALVFASIMIKKYSDQSFPFNKVDNVVIFLFFGVVIQSFISTFIGLLALLIAKMLPLDMLVIMQVGIHWWLAEASGVLFFAPAIAFWVFKNKRLFDKKLFWEGLVVSILTILITIFIFSQKQINEDIPYLLLLPFMWLTVRLSAKFALTVLALMTIIATVSTMHNLGPFSFANTDAPLQSFGLMIMSFNITILSIGALNNEERVVRSELESLNELLEKKVEERTNSLKSLQEVFKKQAITDVLTGILNRRGFMLKAEEEFSRAKRFGEALHIIMLDIDKFKNINDIYGHDVGDIVLKGFKTIFKVNLRDFDVYGRLGGEEFAIVLPCIKKDVGDIRLIAERIRTYVEKIEISIQNDKFLKYTISLGIAVVEQNDNSITEALKRADENLYKAKNTGRNKICY